MSGFLGPWRQAGLRARFFRAVPAWSLPALVALALLAAATAVAAETPPVPVPKATRSAPTTGAAPAVPGAARPGELGEGAEDVAPDEEPASEGAGDPQSEEEGAPQRDEAAPGQGEEKTRSAPDMPVVLVGPGEPVIVLGRALRPLDKVPGLAAALEEGEDGPALAVALQAEGEGTLERLLVPSGDFAVHSVVVGTPGGPLTVDPIREGAHLAFPVLVEPDSPTAVLLKLDATPRRPELHLWEEDAWRAYLARLSFLAGLMEGALFVLAGLLLARGFLAATPAAFASAGLAAAGLLLVAFAAGTLGPPALEAPRTAARLGEFARSLLALAIVVWAFTARPAVAPTRLQLIVGLGLAALAGLGALAGLLFDVSVSAAVLAAALGFAAALFWRGLAQGARGAWWMAPGLFTGLATGAVVLAARIHPGLLPSLSGEMLVLGLAMGAIVLAGLVGLAPGPRLLPEASRAGEAPLAPRIVPVRHEAGERATRVEEAVRAAREGLWEWSIDADELNVAPEIESELGEPAGALSGSAAIWASRLHPEDIELFRSALAAHLENPRSPFDQEFRMMHADGSARWLHLRAQAIAGASGQIERCIGLVADITARRAELERRDGDTLHDALTGLATRALFLDRLGAALAERQGALTLFILDVDRFGLVLDGLGLAAGEELLIGLARRLESFLQPADTLARLGGDSFAILLRRPIARSKALELASALQELIAKPFTLNGQEVFASASIGIALTDSRARTASELLHEAQTALFDAKRTGAGSARVYAPAMRHARGERLALETDLRRALERRQVELVYQPIMSLADSRVAGFEGLLRWRHPARGLLAPKDFLALAEETGLITDLGAFALREAAEQLGKWQTYFPIERPLFVSVNVSSRQFLSEDFVEAVGKILRSRTLARNTLKLEVTESLIMEDPERSAGLLSRLTAEGAGLALDDFGTGFSSLSYLQRFPFDTLKIDRSFVAMMSTDKDAELIVRSIVSLAHAMKLEVVAEGAESEDDAAKLKELGCEFAQGYLYAAPLSADDAQGFIARHWQN